MKNLLSITALLLGSTLSLGAQANDTVRLVFTASPSNIVSAQSAVNNCVSSEDGLASWCIGGQGSVQAQRHVGMKVVTLNAQGYSAQYIAERFNQAGGFGIVEADVQVSAKPVELAFDVTTASTAEVNDPAFPNYQKAYYFADIKDAPSGSDVLGLWQDIGLSKLKTQADPLDVLVLDSEFETNQDVVYFDGRSFSTTALTQGGAFQVPNDDYSVRAEVDDVCEEHGLQVSSVINGLIDNAYGQAGITNNVNLYALRVMTCGTGFLSDVANALKWATGEAFVDDHLVTPYAGKAGIINMSLSSTTTNCPEFMQTAIDGAIAAGFTVVVAAGNQGADSASRSPGNCAGVINVAAIDRQGNLPSFTNRGANISVSAAGTLLPAPCEDSDVTCLASGTSLASPLVAGILAAVKKETGADDKTLKTAIKMTSNAVVDPQCEADGVCGAGQIDARAVLDFARKSVADNLHTIKHALADKTTCEQAWMVDHFGTKAPLCQMYNVSLMAGYEASGMSYVVYSAPKAAVGVEPSWVELGQFQTAQFTLQGVDAATQQYGVKVCEGSVCSADIVLINTDDALSPAACQ